MTDTTIDFIARAQQTVVARGGKEDDWQRIAVELARTLAIARHGSSLAFLQTAFRINFAEQAALKPLKLDTAPPLDLTEQPVNLDTPTVR